MANTDIRINVPDEPHFVRAFLTGGDVPANSAGYAVTPLGNWEFSIAVPEACVGIYRLTLEDGDGLVQRQGWVRIVADDVGPYVAEGDFHAVQNAAGNVVAALNADATQTTQQANAATAATQATAAASLPAPTATQIVAALNADATQGALQSNAATAATQASLAAALPSPTESQIIAAINANETQAVLHANAATAATQSTAAASRSAALVLLIESDQILVDAGGVRVLQTYQRGTTDPLIPAKTAKQPDGTDLTDPDTQRLAGYQEPA